LQRRTFNLSLEQAIEYLRSDYKKMTQDPRGELAGTDPDDAFEAGFNVCLQGLISITGPDPSLRGDMNQTDLDLGDQFATDDTKETS
jgi:hypothetical protein